ncbi:hypothetical protein HY501_02090 [Candidatus Woesearchaeota archaeon]|nr:hypothetical protein [Candidatus Woesearchaeota archaeon]
MSGLSRRTFLKALFAGGAAALYSTHCGITREYPFKPDFPEGNVILDTSLIGKFFLGDFASRPKDEQMSFLVQAHKNLEDYVEEDYSVTLGKRVFIPPRIYAEPQYTLVFSRKGELEVIATHIFLGRPLEEEELAYTFLGQFLGPDVVSLSARELREAGGLLKRRNEHPSPILDKEVDALKSRYTPLKEPAYSADLFSRAGFSQTWGIAHLIKVSPVLENTFYNTVWIHFHEVAHSFVYRHASWDYVLRFYASYLDWGKDKEIVSLNESACTVIADELAIVFQQRHLLKGSKLGKLYHQQKEEKEIANWETRELLSLYEKSGGKISPDKLILKSSGLALTGARLAVLKQYLGTEQQEMQLRFLYKNLGLNQFLDVVGTLHTFDDLGRAVGSVEKKSPLISMRPGICE